jgi:AhpD family alkylhydroperoxidase
MGVESASEFAERRERSNEAVLRHADLPVKRFFALDQDAYEDGALPKRTKELLGLAASTVLRCNDCISHHLSEATASGVTEAEIAEALGIALIVGGSITIPHLRHAFEYLESITSKE